MARLSVGLLRCLYPPAQPHAAVRLVLHAVVVPRLCGAKCRTRDLQSVPASSHGTEARYDVVTHERFGVIERV